MRNSATGLSSVANALAILDCFEGGPAAMGLQELADHLGVAKSTAHRLAATLVAAGYLEQPSRNGRYRLGMRLFELGTLVRRRVDFYDTAKDILHELRDATRETINLAILRGEEVIFLNSIESDSMVRASIPLGRRLPAQAFAEGRVLLAFSTRDADEVAAATRARGYALSSSTSASADGGGIQGLAAPFFDADNDVAGAIGIAGPASRLGRRAVNALLPTLCAAAARLSDRLGARMPHPPMPSLAAERSLP